MLTNLPNGLLFINKYYQQLEYFFYDLTLKIGLKLNENLSLCKFNVKL